MIKQRSFDEVLATIPHSKTFEINGGERTYHFTEADRVSAAREEIAREDDNERRRNPQKPRRVCRVGSHYVYLGPNKKVAMSYAEAKAAFAALAKLQSELDAEIAYGRETGLGDHARVTRLLDEIAKAEGR
jgi:hypothetical protein